MNARNHQPIGTVPLDQLLALNDEIAALVRAGIPLEKGLSDFAQEAPGKLGTVASRLADRMNHGESLAEILEHDTTSFPPVWRSVVLAGIRSDHLAAALESLSQTGRRALELRRAMAVAMIYPAIVVTLAYLLFLFSTAYVIPNIIETYEMMTDSTTPLLRALARLSELIHIWGIAVPIIALLAFTWWWYRSGSIMRKFSTSGVSRGQRLLFGRQRRSRWPSIRQSLFDGRMATFAEVLGLLNDHDVPLPEAIILAADASGDRALSNSARTISKRLENGEPFSGRDDLPSGFPPLLGWSIVAGMGRPGLKRTLATSAEMYRQRAIRASRYAAVYLPIILTVVVGGSAVLFQVVLMFLPFVTLLYRLGAPL